MTSCSDDGVDSSNCCSSVNTYVDQSGISIEIPNFFSPNRDGINEVFIIPDLDPNTINKFQVFRGNELLFSKDQYKNDFEGVDSSGNTISDGFLKYILTVNQIEYTGEICMFRTEVHICDLTLCLLTNFGDPIYDDCD